MGIGSQKLMSFLLSTTALSDIVHAVADVFADALLTGEAEGFAIDATGVTASPAYVGAPEGGYISIKEYDSPAALMSNLPLDDPRSPLVQSGTSPKLVRYHSDNGDSPGSDYPLLRWTPHNYCLRSQEFDNATWNKTLNGPTIAANDTTAPDGTLTADKFTNGTSGSAETNDTDALTALGVYTISVYVKSGTAPYLFLAISDTVAHAFGAWFNLSTHAATGSTNSAGDGTYISASVTNVDGTWYRYSVTGNFAASHTEGPDIWFTNADNAFTTTNGHTGWAWGVQIVRGYNANPYLATTTAARIGIPQEYDTAEGQYGILVEPAATNVCLQSEALGSWQDIVRSSVSANAITAPDGSTTADKIVEDVTTGAHHVDQVFTGTAASWTASIFAKSGERTKVTLALYDGTSYTGQVSFDLSTGAVIATTSGSGTITSVGNGWYRLTVTATLAASAACLIDAFIMDASGNISYTGDGSSGAYFWGGQVETGTVATSYIPTLSSTVTRGTDIITAAASTAPTVSTELGWWTYAKLSGTVTPNALISLSHLNEKAEHYIDAGPAVHQYAEHTGAAQADFTVGSVSLNTAFKASGRWKANDFHGAVGGTLSGTPDTSGTMPAGNTFRFGYNLDVPAAMITRIYQFAMVPRAYTNTELQTKST